MASVFQTNEITQAGLRLIAESSSANPIAFVDALSASQIPQDPEDAQGYNGIGGTIDASSATDATARVVALFGNTITSESQVVKAIAIRAKLASQSDSDAVIFAYSYDADSSIYFPSMTAPSQRTRFAFAFDFSQTQNVSVTEAGRASLADLERFVSCHKAGNPNSGEDQTILGDKYWYGQQDFDEACRFHNTVVTHGVFPETDNAYSLGLQNARYEAIYGGTVNSSIVMADSVSAGDARVGSLHVGTILTGETPSPDVDIEVGSSISPEHTLVSNGFSSVCIGSSNARFATLYAETFDGWNLTLNGSSTSDKATLRFDENAILTDKDLVPATNTGAVGIQSCGRISRPWREICVKNAIHLTNGSSSTSNILTIYEDDGGINFDNSYTGGDAGIYRFRKRTGGSLVGATVSAGEFIGANPTISKASISAIPESEVVPVDYDGDVVTIPIGGLILAIPAVTWMQNGGVGREIKPGESITITDENKDAFRVADWRAGESGSGYSPKILSASKYAFLKVGTYRALSYVTYPSGSQHPTGGAPILLQRVA